MLSKIYRSIIIASIVTFGFINIAGAQQNNILYFMNKIPQANELNPAFQQECKINFGGLMVPVAGQLLPPLYINYSNNAFALKDIFQQGTGLYADSLIHPFHPKGDADKFFKKLRPINFINLETHINLFSAGYKFKDYYFTFNLNEKIDVNYAFHKDLIQFPYLMNGSDTYLGEEANLSGLGLSAIHYREYSFGASKVINSKLTAGAHIKMLFGKANLNTAKSDILFKTDKDDFAYTISTDMEFNMSQPFVRIDSLYYDNVGDSLVSETTELDPDIVDYVLNGKNFGMALDLGATYKLNDKFTFYGSITDFGFIKWKDNVTNITSKGKFYFDGYDIVPSLEGNDSIIEAQDDELLDSVTNLFDIKQKADAYNTGIITKFYFGGTYNLNDKIGFGLLSRSIFYNRRLHSSLTASVNTNLTKWFGASVSYSIINNSFANVGAGLMLKGGPIQFYFMTDNLLAPMYYDSAQNANYRMGINIIFGCKKASRSLYN